MSNTVYSIDIGDNSNTMLKEAATQVKGHNDTTEIDKLISFVAVLTEYNVKQHLIDGRIPGEKVCIRGCRRWAVRKTTFRRWVARKLRCKISHLRI